jgi:hypothetical protein
MPWEEWFGLSEDPFDPKPLQTEEQFKCLLVRTKPISDRIEPLVHQAPRTSICKMVLGDKGVGKSTVLRYCLYLAAKERMIPVLIQFHPAGVAKSRNPVLETLSEVMTQIIQQEITYIYELFSDLFTKYQSTFLNIAKFVGLQWQEAEGFYKDPFAVPPSDQKLLKGSLESISGFLEKSGISVLVVIDNLDKLPFEVSRDFLGGQMAQPLFEYLNQVNCSVFIAIDPALDERIQVESDLSYLGERIRLIAILPGETRQLIEYRIKLVCNSQEKLSEIIIDQDLIIRVCNQKKGNTREILKEFSQLFQLAYETETKHLSINLYDKPIPKMSSIEYYELIEQNSEAKNGAERILSMIPKLTDTELPRAKDYLSELFKNRQTTIESILLKKLFEFGIIVSTKKVSSYELQGEVQVLLSECFKRGLPPKDFLSWVMNKDTSKTISSRYPTLRSRRIINRALDITKSSVEKTGKVSIIIGAENYPFKPETVQWSFPENYMNCKKFLDIANGNYKLLEKQDWEDANPFDIQNYIYYTLLNFLLSYSYYFVLYSKVPFRTKDLSYWPLIFSVLKNSKSIPLVIGIRKAHYSTIKGDFQPTVSMVNQQLQDLEKILVEIAGEWEQASLPHLPSDKNAALKEKIQEKLIETANENLWRDVHVSPEFDLSAQRTQELGIKKRDQFLFIKTEFAETISEESFLSFIASAEGIIKKQEQIEVNNKDFLKPNYYLWIISHKTLNRLSKTVITSAPRNRVYLKNFQEEEIPVSFKRLNIVDFLDLENDLLDSEDFDVFQKAQEDFYIKGACETADNCLNYFEHKMQKIIKDILSHHLGVDWYNDSTVPAKNEIDKRVKNEGSKLPIGVNVNEEPLEYAFISDLMNIILKKENWQEFFSPIFHNNDQLREKFRVKFDEIRELRNKVKHGHELAAFNCNEATVQQVIQNIVWILSYMNQYRKVTDIFSSNKSIKFEERPDGKIVSLGRITELITKRDADVFDATIKKLAGKDIYKTGGLMKLDNEDLETTFGLERQKVILLLALSKEKGIISISHGSSNDYKLSFIR